MGKVCKKTCLTLLEKSSYIKQKNIMASISFSWKIFHLEYIFIIILIAPIQLVEHFLEM